jgi:hypothetical protein
LTTLIPAQVVNKFEKSTWIITKYALFANQRFGLCPTSQITKIPKVSNNLIPMDKKERKLLFEVEEIIIGISSILLIIAAFLAWGPASSGEITTGVSAEGVPVFMLHITDGMLTIGIGAIAIGLLIVDMIYRVPAWIPLILGIIALGIGVIDFWAMAKATGQYWSVGTGLYLTLLASGGIIVGSIVDIYRDTKK